MKINVNRNEVKALGFALIAALFYALMASTVKWVSRYATTQEIVFYRNSVCVLILAFIVLRKKIPLKTKNLPLLGFRSLVGICALYSFYHTARNMPLVDAVLLMNTAPLFVPVVAFIWYGKRIPKERWLAIMVGFLGVIFILRPSFSFFNWDGLIGLISGVFMSLSYVSVRRLTKVEPREKILVYFFFLTWLFSIVPLFSVKEFTSDKKAIFLMCLVGLFSYIYQHFLTKSFSYATVTKTSIVGYFSVAISGIFGWLFFGNIPDIWTFAGIAIVFLGGYLMMREKKPTHK
ncbi:MAG TPA: DMT family transporter [Chlamydiales bacterium]|nr:DMT family transporter [Chlamydiales bacterium]